MAQLSVEQSAYSKSQQQYLANLKVGQFSKFLNKNPIFVTYYVVNQAQSRTDSGTGSAHEEIGPNSPIRYNKVTNLPTFNIPELRPDVVNDEGGYDIELDLTDIAFIAGTIRPKPGDYMRVDLANTKPLLYRCNNYRHNTIQSNDYYQADFDLVDINQRYLVEIEHQVEEVYDCKFENIGTNQKVLMTAAEQSELDDLAYLIDDLTQFYNDVFYNADVDGFVLYNGNPPYSTQWYVDNYLTRFINESQIFVNENSDYTTVLPYLELLPLNFDMLYRRSLWYAVLKRSNSYMHPYLYAWSRLIQKRTSPLLMASIPCLHPTLEIFDKWVKPEEKPDPNLQDVIWTPGSGCGFAGYDPSLRTYFPWELQSSVANNIKSDKMDLVEKMIFQYISGGINSVTFDKKSLIEYSFKQDLHTYMLMPIIIYILKQALSAKSSNDDTTA